MSGNQFFTILTEVGKRKFRDAIAVGGCINLRDIAVGDGGGLPTDPNSQMTALVNEVYRAPISNNTYDPVNPAYAILNLVIPIEVGGWYVREAGVYDTEGDLIFVGSLPSTYKPLPSMGVASDLSINLIIDVENAETITITVDPSTVLASQAWTEKAINNSITAAWEKITADPDQAPVSRAWADEAIANAIAAAWNNHVCVGEGQQAVRETLTIYVRTDGDDTNDGRSEEAAKASLEGAIRALAGMTVQAGGKGVIDLGPGEFAATQLHGPLVASAGGDREPLELRGAGKDETVIRGTLTFKGMPELVLRDLTVEGTLNAWERSYLMLYSIRFSGKGQRGLDVGFGSIARFMDDGSEAEGEFEELMAVWGKGTIWIRGLLLTISGTTRFTRFVDVASGGMFYCNGKFHGAENAVGQRWRTYNGGMICTSGVDPDDIFPGTENGESLGLAISGTTSSSQEERGVTAQLTLYVRADGSDANDGLSQYAAKASLRAAMRAATGYKIWGGGRVVIDVGAGEFASPGIWYGTPAASAGSDQVPFVIQGAGKDQTAITGDFALMAVPSMQLNKVSMRGTLIVSDKSLVVLHSIRLIGNGRRGLDVSRGAHVYFADDGSAIEGDFTECMALSASAHVMIRLQPLTFSGVTSFDHFVEVTTGSSFGWQGKCVNPELASGRRWRVINGGMLCTYGTDPDKTYPGSEPGMVEMPVVDSGKSPGSRIRANADVVVHVRADGDDASDGLTEATAVATLAGALEALGRIDAGIRPIIVDIGPGEFKAPNVCGQLSANGGGSKHALTFRGAGKEQTTLSGQVACLASFFVLDNMTVHGQIQASDTGEIWISRMKIVGDGDAGLTTYRNSLICIRDSELELEGNFSSVLYSGGNAVIDFGSRDVTISGPLTANIFGYATTGGSINDIGEFRNKELATCRRWYLNQGGILMPSGRDLDDVFPGNQAGYAEADRRVIANITPADCLTKSLASTGYAKMPGGLIVQWGSLSFEGNSGDVTLPIAFPTAMMHANVVDSVQSGNPASLALVGVANQTAQGFTILSRDENPGAVRWMALGY